MADGSNRTVRDSDKTGTGTSRPVPNSPGKICRCSEPVPVLSEPLTGRYVCWRRRAGNPGSRRAGDTAGGCCKPGRKSARGTAAAPASSRSAPRCRLLQEPGLQRMDLESPLAPLAGRLGKLHGGHRAEHLLGQGGSSPSDRQRCRRPATASLLCIKQARPPSPSPSNQRIEAARQSTGVGSSVPGQSKAACSRGCWGRRVL